MQGSDVILTLTDLAGGSLSAIGQPMDDEDLTTADTFAGTVSLAISTNTDSTTIVEITGSQTDNAQTAANLKQALGLGANAATPATAAEIAAALLKVQQGGFLAPSSLLRFGQDAVTNTAAAAGTTPDLISKFLVGLLSGKLLDYLSIKIRMVTVRSNTLLIKLRMR